MPEPATLVKRNSDAGAFPVNFAKFLRTPILKNTWKWVLLNVTQVKE